MRLAWLALTLIGCGGAARLHGRFGEPLTPVRGFAIAGNHAFTDHALAKLLGTPAGYSEISLDLDRQRLLRFYAAHGFFSVRVTGQVRPVEGGVAVRFDVVEGTPTQISDVALRGAPAALEAELRGLVRLTPGQRYDHAAYLGAKARLRGKLVDRGYASARVDGLVLVDREHQRAGIELRVEPGPLTEFGQVHVEGTHRIPREAVEARAAFRPGDRYDPDKVRRTEVRLYGLGFFSSVRVEPQLGQGAPVADVAIRVREARRHEVRLGVGATLDEHRIEVHGRAAYVVRSWLHPLVTLTLDGRPGYTFGRGALIESGFTGDLLAGVSKDDFLARRVRARVEAAYEFRPYEAYVTRGPRGRIGVERAFAGDRLLASLGWSATRLTVVEEDWLAPALDAHSPYALTAIEQSLVWDGRDDPLQPHQGLWAALRIEEGSFFSGAPDIYVRVAPEARVYFPLGDRVVMASVLRVGAVTAGREAAPLTRRFFGGGSNGHRGFGTRRLSPMARSPDGDLAPVGAKLLVESSLEARVQAFKLRGKWLGVVLFLDAGDARRDLERPPLGDLHVAVGGGLRWETPVGSLRFDMGVRLNRLGELGPGGELNPDPGDRVALHLSLGEAF